jgi:hypothetical protein
MFAFLNEVTSPGLSLEVENFTIRKYLPSAVSTIKIFLPYKRFCTLFVTLFKLVVCYTYLLFQQIHN